MSGSGDGASLVWQVTNADRLTITPDVGAVSGASGQWGLDFMCECDVHGFLPVVQYYCMNGYSEYHSGPISFLDFAPVLHFIARITRSGNPSRPARECSEARFANCCSHFEYNLNCRKP